MKVKVIKSEGLSHELEVTVPGDEIDRKVEARLREIGKTAKMSGFRKGKIPSKILKNRYGASVRGEILQATVSESSTRAMEDEQIKPAMQPKIEVESAGEGEDLVYTVNIDSMPDVEVKDLMGLKLTRLVAEPDSELVEERLEAIQESYRLSLAEKGLDEADEVEFDDDFAQSVGMESMEALKKAVEEQLAGELGEHSRTVLKRKLLDHLDKANAFDLPAGMASMAELEFNNIVQQVEMERRQSDENASVSDEEKNEYRDIAQRRVRLGLVVAEIGNSRNFVVTEQEIRQAVIAEAQKFPGQEKEVLEYFAENPSALESLRAPLLEEQVVDYLLGMADVTEKTVKAKDLLNALEAEGD